MAHKQEYDHGIKGPQDYDDKPHALFDYYSGRAEQGSVGDQIMSHSLIKSKRFLKLNGLEVGTKVNPHQNIVVEAGNFVLNPHFFQKAMLVLELF